MSIFGRVSAKLSDFLAQEPVSAGNQAPPASRSDERSVLPPAEFDRQLKALLSSGAGTAPLAGRINFIGLSKIRERVGPRWDLVRERADDVARRAIEHRLTPADVYTRYNELQYLIIFAQLPKEQAQMKCALIAEEITKRLLGDEITPDLLEVKTVVSELGGDFKFEDVPDITELAKLVSKGGDTPDAAPMAKDAAEDEDRWWEDTNDPTIDPLKGVQFVYRPMWDVRRKAITTYVCAPARVAPDGRLLCGEAQLPAITGAGARLDFLVQRRVITDLRQLVAANQRMLLCLPVHFETLAATARRTTYLDLCRRGVPQNGSSLLLFELVGLPAGVPRSRLLEFSMTLRPFSRGVLLRTKLEEPVFLPATDTGLAGVGFEIDVRPGAEAAQIRDMERYAAAAKKFNLMTYVHGLRSMSLTTAAVAAGFDYVNGDTITSVVQRPGHAYRYETMQLFQRLGKVS